MAGPILSRAAKALSRAVALRCPRCGGTALFRGWFRMAERCAVCGLVFERAQGYFVGAIYVNYAATTALAVAGYLLLWRSADLSTAIHLMIWAPFVVVFPLWFFRYSRSVWLALEHLLNPEP